ncbi:unnamed protein product [Ixodes pacificus]
MSMTRLQRQAKKACSPLECGSSVGKKVPYVSLYFVTLYVPAKLKQQARVYCPKPQPLDHCIHSNIDPADSTEFVAGGAAQQKRAMLLRCSELATLPRVRRRLRSHWSALHGSIPLTAAVLRTLVFPGEKSQ